MGTPAGVWVRVSTGAQDEANQVPDIERYCAANGLDILKRYELNDKSAFKGEQDAKLAEMLDDMRAGLIRELVCWYSDRLERRGVEALFKLLRLAREGGGRIISTQEPTLGADDISAEGMTALSAIMSHAESVKKSERVRIALDARRQAKALWGRPPYGFRIVTGPDDYKYLVPDRDGTARVVLDMVNWYLCGLSLMDIARGLDYLHIAPSNSTTVNGWSAKIVRQILSSESLIGKRRNGQGKVVMTYEGLIDRATWNRLQALLETNSRRHGAVRKAPALLTGIAYCGKCEGILHYRRSPKARLDGSVYVWAGYRCDGDQKHLSACKNMYPAEALESAIDHMLTTHDVYGLADREIVETKVIEAGDHLDELAEVEDEIASLDQDDPEYDSKHARLRAERKRLKALPVEPPKVVERGTRITVGQHWASLDKAGKRAYLLATGIKIYADRHGSPDVWTIGEIDRITGALTRRLDMAS